MSYITDSGLTDWELKQAQLDELYSFDPDEPWYHRQVLVTNKSNLNKMSKIKSSAEAYALGQINLQQLEEVCGGPVPQVVQNYISSYTKEFNTYQAYRKAKSETAISDILLQSYLQRQEQLPLHPAALIVFQNGVKAAVVGCSKDVMKDWLKRHPEVSVYHDLRVGDTFYVVNYVDLQYRYEHETV